VRGIEAEGDESMDNVHAAPESVGEVLTALSREKALDREMWFRGLQEVLKEFRPIIDLIKNRLVFEDTANQPKEPKEPESEPEAKRTILPPAYRLAPRVQRELWDDQEPERTKEAEVLKEPEEPKEPESPNVEVEAIPSTPPAKITMLPPPTSSTVRLSSSFESIPSPPVSQRVRPKKEGQEPLLKVRAAKSRLKWTQEAVDIVIALVKQAEDIHEKPDVYAIAKNMGRSRDSIATLISKLKHGKWRSRRVHPVK